MLSKLMTAIRGNASRVDDAFTDANAHLILEQEIADAAKVHRAMTNDLATIMAHEMSLRRAVERTETSLAERTRQAEDALAKSEMALAEDLADRIVLLEEELEGHRTALDEQRERVRKVRTSVDDVEIRLKRLRQRQTQVRDTHLVQKAQRSGASVGQSATSVLQTAEDSLARIAAVQEAEADKTAALRQLAEEAGDQELTRSLEDTGIVKSNQEKRRAVLQRLKDQAQKETTQ